MRILVISQTGFGFGLASYLSNEGHTINTFIRSGLDVPQITRLVQSNTPDIAVFDSNQYVVPAEWARTRGIRVLGPSPWSNLLDSNSDYQTSLIKAIGYAGANKSDNGIDVATSCLFNGHRFIAQSLVFNYTKIMAGNVGIDVPSSGYIVYFKVEDSKLVKDTLEPLEKFLRKANHRGCFTIYTTIKDDGSFVVQKVSADLSQPFVQAVCENTRKSRTDILLDIFNEASEPIPFIEPYVCGVMISAYPYPATVPFAPVVVNGLNPLNLKHLWVMDATKGEEGWLCGFLTGCVGFVTARGKDHFEAQRRAYHTIKNIKLKGLQYRTDIGKDIGEKLFQLRKLKLIGG